MSNTAAENNIFSIVVLISGNGSNLQAIIDAEKAGAPYHVAAVISNHADAFGLQRAERANIPHHVLDHRQYPTRDDFDQALADLIDQYRPQLVVLAGFMRILSNAFVDRFANRLINIHPSLLPKYPGLHTHRRALAAGDHMHGVSIHYVTHELDGGPIIEQAALEILKTDTEASLQQRVHQLEHVLYPSVISTLAKKFFRPK